MKKYLVFVLLVLPSYCYALMNPYLFGISVPSSDEVACTGTFASGDIENFEADSDGSFCTTGFVETDAGGYITTNSTTQYRTGAKSAKFVNSGSYRIQADITSDDQFKITFSIYIPTISLYDAVSVMKILDTASNDALLVRYRHHEAGYEIYMDGASTHLSIPAANEWYDIELFMDSNGGTCKMSGERVSNTTALDDGGDGVIEGTSEVSNNSRYIRFLTESNNAYTHYIDAVTYDSTATDL